MSLREVPHQNTAWNTNNTNTAASYAKPSAEGGVPAPSRRPPATAFQPVQQQQQQQQQQQMRGSSPSNANGPSEQQQQQQDFYVPPSSNTAAADMIAHLDQLTHTLMGQIKSIGAVRDSIMAELSDDGSVSAENAMVTRRVDTLVSQIKPLFSEADEILGRLRREDVKLSLPQPQQQQQQSSTPSTSQSSPTAPSPHSEHQQQFASSGVAAPSRRAPAVPAAPPASVEQQDFQQQQQQQFEEEGDVYGQQQQQQQPQPNYNNMQNQNQNQQQQGGRNYHLVPRNNAEVIPAPRGAGNKRYVRASQVYVESENNNNNANNANDGGAFSGNNNNMQQQQQQQHQMAAAAAAAPSSFAERSTTSAVPDHLRRQQRNAAHNFCVVEFKCHRMKRYPCTEEVQPGQYVICWGDKGEDCGLVVLTGFIDDMGNFHNISVFQDMHVELGRVRNVSDVYILRTASAQEVDTLHSELASYEESALAKCQQMAVQRGLKMRVTDCEIQFDRQKFTFYFDAVESIDFRDLTRDLHRLFRARIWLENINANVKNVVPEGALSQADKKIYAARGVRMSYR